jgi:hypothetical protein
MDAHCRLGVGLARGFGRTSVLGRDGCRGVAGKYGPDVTTSGTRKGRQLKAPKKYDWLAVTILFAAAVVVAAMVAPMSDASRSVAFW